MKKIKILYFSHSSSLAGGERSLLILIKYLDRSTFDPVVILPTKGLLLDELKKLNVHTYVIPLRWWISNSKELGALSPNIYYRLGSIEEIIKIENPDIIHTNTSVILEGALSAKKNRIPHIWHIHEILDGHPSMVIPFPLPLIYFIMDKLSAKIVVVSEAVKKAMLNIIPENKIKIIYNGIEINKLTHIRGSSIRKEINIPNDTPIAVTIGSIVREKGYDNLLNAISLVKKNKSNVKFIIVGTGKPKAVHNLKKCINKLNLKEYVYYLGFREDIPNILSGSDFLILPSCTEGFPLAPLEAMAAGKPIIATNCGGLPEIVSDGEFGFLVPINNPQDLSEKILYMIENKDKTREMGIKAQKNIIEKFKPETYVEKFQNLYKEMTKERDINIETEKEKVLLDAFIKYYEEVELFKKNQYLIHFKKLFDLKTLIRKYLYKL